MSPKSSSASSHCYLMLVARPTHYTFEVVAACRSVSGVPLPQLLAAHFAEIRIHWTGCYRTGNRMWACSSPENPMGCQHSCEPLRAVRRKAPQYDVESRGAPVAPAAVVGCWSLWRNLADSHPGVHKHTLGSGPSGEKVPAPGAIPSFTAARRELHLEPTAPQAARLCNDVVSDLVLQVLVPERLP